MKSNVNREDTDAKKKYVFFSDPDVIVRRAESTAAASQALQNLKIHEQQRRGEPKVSQSEPETSAGTLNPQIKSDLKGLETLLSYHPVQPYPFTFITAVKRKLALSMHAEACKRAYEPEKLEKLDIDTDVNRSNTDFKRSINQATQMMDFIKPLKVPDLKISPKTLDYSPRESVTAKDIVQSTGSLSSKKFDIHPMDNAALASNKSPKSSEKVHRKLDFSLFEGSPIKSCENIEPLKAPDLCIGFNLSKKKEHARDSSREKENRSKRIKKDDSGIARKDDFLKETPRRLKSSKHLSRKDVEEESDPIFEMFRPENFLSNPPRESDFGFKKPKTKNFLTSTVKKNDDKRHRSVSMQSVRSGRERSSESKNKVYDNDSNSEKSIKVYERNTRDDFRGKLSESVEQLHKISNQDFSTLRECDDHKYKNSEQSSSKQQKHLAKSVSQGQTKQFENYSKTQIKKSYEKQKAFSSEPETKELNTTSEISEDIKTASGSIPSLKNTGNVCRTDVTSETDDDLKSNKVSREVEQSSRNSQAFNQTEKFHDNPEGETNIENLPSQSTNTDTRIVENSTNQVDISTTSSSQNNSNSDYKNSQSKSLSGIILDPTRISFRDENYDEQNEFCDLVTPDINLIPRLKRRKNFVQEENNEADLRSPKHQPTASNVQSKDEGIQLLHPTALHMQFQAELHLLDSFNESLRQVMDVENCLYTAKHEKDQEILLKQKENEIRRKNLMFTQTGRDTVDIERHQGDQIKNVQETNATKKNDSTQHFAKEKDDSDIHAVNTGNENPTKESNRVVDRAKQSQSTIGDSDYVSRKNDRSSVRVTEVQTQTANDIATQTETPRVRRRHNSPGRQIPGITYQRGSSPIEEIPQLSLESFDQPDDFDQIENVSLPSRMHTMSEISLHETTSSIRTETGTEISISTRDVTCSFNKYLDSELVQLIKDEKQRYDEIEMLFKSREKTLNDRTKKLVKLEEQKRALRDMGQDSRISSVKKKQRALLLKLQQEKDEMNRLKELHKKASQERKLMLQKQRNMLNPQMSTKNILTKLKRSADSQSPRRLSGPMKGYDIRSPSSMSSLVDSDKSQLDRSHIETKASISNVRLHKSEGRMQRSDIIASGQEGHDLKSVKSGQFDNMTEQSDTSLLDSHLSPESQKFIAKQQKFQNSIQKTDTKSKYEAKVCKYKEAMPKIEIPHYKTHGTDLESNISSKKSIKSDNLASSEKSKSKETQLKQVQGELDKSISENIRSESDTLVDDFCKKSKSSQGTEINFEHLKLKREKETTVEKSIFDSEHLNIESDSIPEELSSKKSKSSQAMDDVSEMTSKNSRKTNNTSGAGKESCKKLQSNPKSKSNSKRKGSRSVKSKSSSDILSENILRSKSGSQISEEIMKHHSKRSKIEKDDAQTEENYENSFIDDNESQSSLHALVKHSRAIKEKNYQLLRNIADEHEAKENICRKDSENLQNVSGRQDGNLQNVGNMSTRSQVSTLTISHHSSGESEKSYSRSVVIRAQDHHFRTSKKLEQILTAREAALASRRSCVEEWIAWHSRLRAEESRVARMEEAAFKLVSAASNALPYHDTTVSSDTSDVESRIEILAEKLAERRTEMARLKREAKRQAKQRLKALETNLLNQIKKYDTTIHEMRKKLENKRGALFNDGSSEKLAIESKSLTDFKIPDIPIKRIKEICKNSDLLKSKSESEFRSLMSENIEQKDIDVVYRSENSEHDNTSYRKSPRSIASDITDRSEMSSSDKKATTQSIQSIFEDVKSTASKEPDFISENIESRSISEQIEVIHCTPRAKSYDKSEDELSNVSLKSKSDQGSTNEIEDDNSKTKTSKESIISEASRASMNDESHSISENIQKAGSVGEIESESIETVPEVKFSKSYDISAQDSASKFFPSEVSSEIDLHDSGKMTEMDSATRAISNTTSLNVAENTSNSKNDEIIKSESPRLTSSRVVSPKTVDSEIQLEASALEIHLVQELTKNSKNDKFASENDTLQILSDNSSPTEEPSVIHEINVDKSVEESQSFSKKLSFLELGNKNLNDDISTLENDLKALSEMMSQFSKKSDNRLRSEIIYENKDRATSDSDKGTFEDITDIGDHEDVANSKTNATYIVEEEDEQNSEFNDRDITAQVTEIMLKIMPENVTPSPDFNQEIDFKARSREILNEIEKSIISEHVKSPDSKDTNLKTIEKNISSLENKNEEVVGDLNSLENDIMSIAEIISHASEAKRDIRMISSLGHDQLFEDEDPVDVSSKSHELASEKSGKLENIEENRPKIPLLNLAGEFGEEEDASPSPDESMQSLQSPETNLGKIDCKNAARNAAETSASNFEQTDIMFETLKDPEYEDISEESLEVSEIMDRSESQRSSKQLYPKSNRLPEKYQTTQKSEDVLRILDEITQRSNSGNQRSQQFFLTPDNHGRKIDELLQRSEKLSQNFEALTKKPVQSDTALNVTIPIAQTLSEKSISQTEIVSQRPGENLSEFIPPQSIGKVNQSDDVSQEFEQQKPDNDFRDIEVKILPNIRNKADNLTDITIGNNALNLVKSPNKLERHQIKDKKDNLSAPLDALVTSVDQTLETSVPLSPRTDIQRQKTTELVKELEISAGKAADTIMFDRTLEAADARSEFHLQEANNKSQIAETAISVPLENLSEARLLEDECAQQIEEESGSWKSDDHSENSDGSINTSGDISQTHDEINFESELVKYEETSVPSKNLIDPSPGDEKIEALSKKPNVYSYNVEIHESEHINATPRSTKDLLRKFEVETQSRKIVETEGFANLPDIISHNHIEKLVQSNEFNAKIDHVDTIHSFEDELQKIEETRDPAGFSRELGAISPKSEDSLTKINVAEKSDESQGSEKSEDCLQKYEVELPSESSEEIETPRSVSEIEMDSPRDPNDSRLDIDGLDDDLLANNNFGTQNVELRTEYQAAPAVATSEKDIEAMIDKLKVSLEQPGLDVAELEAKLLRIQQLQIELEIKKLEAEEVSYYVREIPNKPPPPYTPPSGGRLSVSQTSPSPAPAVVPTNVEDLTSFTERATHLIYQAKQSGDNIINLEPPIEICELSKDNNETARRDRKIYNTFLFDLCKETVSEVYQSEYEKPGPSWLKPNAKTKPTMKIPKTVDDLNDYVSKEVATLFGFKTKLQRENLVMRWSRKRRDRVDELLAREAQAEEDEWTKFHHDELAVKNELTTAILDSLILDAANVVKLAYIKKRKVTS